jgi:hypothetical protein
MWLSVECGLEGMGARSWFSLEGSRGDEVRPSRVRVGEVGEVG